MYLAIGVEPTNETAWMPGCWRIASTATLSPCTTFNTPSGSPASWSNSAMRTEADGTFSDGFHAPLHRAHRVGERLAVLLGDDARQRFLLALEQLQELLQNARAAQRR